MFTVLPVTELGKIVGYVGYQLGDWARPITGVCQSYGHAWQVIAERMSDRYATRSDYEGMRRWRLA
jgi:hypothetical protein